jgi:hypothetical protein
VSSGAPRPPKLVVAVSARLPACDAPQRMSVLCLPRARPARAFLKSKKDNARKAKKKKSNAEHEHSYINTSPKKPCHPAHYVVSCTITSCIQGQEKAKKTSEKLATLR